MFNHGGKAQAFLKQIFPKEALQGNFLTKH